MPNKAIKKEELIASHKLLPDKFKKQAEAFRSDEAWLRTLIDRLPFDIFLIGRDDRYLLQNTSCKNNWGDIIGKRPEDVCKDKKTLAIWKSNNSRAFGGETVEEEVSFKVKGEKKNYFNIISPVREKKEITGILGINIDITKLKQTDRKKTQKGLEESERKYRELVEDISDSIYSIDTKGNVVYISPAIKSLIGYEPHEIIGKNFSDFVHSDDLQTMKKNFESSLEGKATPVDYRIINKAGSYVWIRALSKTIKDDKNNVIGIRGVVSDITERKHMEEALRLSENQLTKAQRIAGVGFLTWNLKTNKIVWSDEIYELYGCEKDKFKVTIESTVGLVHPDDLEYVQKNLDAAVKGIDKYDIDHRMVRPDGRVIWIHANAELVRDKDGNPELFLGTVLDITHRKAVQGQLDSLRRELLHITRRSTMGELTAALAHELNQPLAAILTNAQAAQRFLKKEKTDLDIVRDILTDIVSDDKRAAEIILRLRSLMSTRTVEFNELDINELVDGIIPLIRSDAIIKNVKLTVDLKKGTPPVLGDQIELQQVLLNIILNGFESMEDKDKKELTIFTKQGDAETITVCFRDSGFGIKEEDIENIFRPFITTKKKGMGMGLTISRSIIEAHGGKIWAKNNPDEGATFYFTLPVKSKVQNNAKS
jgi:PAS domain S-box-containing protein